MTAGFGTAGYNWSRAVPLLLGSSRANGVGDNIGDVERCQLAVARHSHNVSGVEARLAGSAARFAVLVIDTSLSMWRRRWSRLLDCCQLLDRLHAHLTGLWQTIHLSHRSVGVCLSDRSLFSACLTGLLLFTCLTGLYSCLTGLYSSLISLLLFTCLTGLYSCLTGLLLSVCLTGLYSCLTGLLDILHRMCCAVNVADAEVCPVTLQRCNDWSDSCAATTTQWPTNHQRPPHMQNTVLC